MQVQVLKMPSAEKIKAALVRYAEGKGMKVEGGSPKLKGPRGNVTLQLAEEFNGDRNCPQTTILQWRPDHPYSLYAWKLISFAGDMVPQLQGVMIDFMFNEIK